MKRYDYESRVIIELDNNSRYSFNREKYGPLLEIVIQQSLDQQRRVYNPYKAVQDYVEFYYWDRKNSEVYSILIDSIDYDLIKEKYWQIHGNGHVISRSDGEKVWLHRTITNCPEGKFVDHIDRNPLNNKRDNLRIVTIWENNLNKEKNNYTGITYRNGKWRVTCSNKLKQETYCDSFEEAIQKRRLFVEKLFKIVKNAPESSTTIRKEQDISD